MFDYLWGISKKCTSRIRHGSFCISASPHQSLLLAVNPDMEKPELGGQPGRDWCIIQDEKDPMHQDALRTHYTWATKKPDPTIQMLVKLGKSSQEHIRNPDTLSICISTTYPAHLLPSSITEVCLLPTTGASIWRGECEGCPPRVLALMASNMAMDLGRVAAEPDKSDCETSNQSTWWDSR